MSLLDKDTGGYLGRNYHIDETEQENMRTILEEDVKHRIKLSSEELTVMDEGMMARSAKPGEIPLSVLNTVYEIKKLYDTVKARENKATTPNEEMVLSRFITDLNSAYEGIRRSFPSILNSL
jgi:hypothetical protein